MAPSALEDSPVAAALSARGVPALRRVRVVETDTSVELLGTVPSFYVKQLAQEAVLPLLRGRKLLNRLAVVRD